MKINQLGQTIIVYDCLRLFRKRPNWLEISQLYCLRPHFLLNLLKSAGFLAKLPIFVRILMCATRSCARVRVYIKESL